MNSFLISPSKWHDARKDLLFIFSDRRSWKGVLFTNCFRFFSWCFSCILRKIIVPWRNLFCQPKSYCENGKHSWSIWLLASIRINFQREWERRENDCSLRFECRNWFLYRRSHNQLLILANLIIPEQLARLLRPHSHILNPLLRSLPSPRNKQPASLAFDRIEIVLTNGRIHHGNLTEVRENDVEKVHNLRSTFSRESHERIQLAVTWMLINDNRGYCLRWILHVLGILELRY